MLKRELRQLSLNRMRSMSAVERAEGSALIVERLFSEFALTSNATIHIFLPIDSNNEVETQPIIDRIRRDLPQATIAVPRVRGDQLETLRFDPDTKLQLSNWNVPEPISDSFIDPRQIDLVIVPLLAFDRRGHRVGYGKGFYDRFLRTCRPDCVKVGVSFFPPVENIEDANENDVRLDLCLTPFASFKFG